MSVDLTLGGAHHELGACSAPMREVVSMAERVALSDATVLITGESGVGKERLAHAIHRGSRRRDAPFVPINCGALPATLLESELFGHRRGAFTGAHADRAGLFEAAQKGTLFLDEIAEMPLDMQAVLLRVLQEREVRRLGDNQARRIDVRILAATNRNLADDVQTHRFRQDLFYRVSVIVIKIPPLRERSADLDLLLQTLLTAAAQRLQRSLTGYTDAARHVLRRYAWPGNVRELQNVIEHACILARGDAIDVDDLPEHVRCNPASNLVDPLSRSLYDVEREHIQAVLRQAGGNRRLAATQLRIGIATLNRKLRRYARERATREQSK